MALAETLANQAAAALALLESEQRRAARAERDAALSRAAVALGSSLELVDVLETFAREANLAMGGAQAGVYLADGVGRRRRHGRPQGPPGVDRDRAEPRRGRRRAAC